MFQVFHQSSAARTALGQCALTIGKYDGMHLGHQKILAELKAVAAVLKVPTLVILSEPHPEEFFSPATAPARLNHFADKVAYLQDFGIDAVYCLQFDASVSKQPAEAFVQQTLVEGLGMRAIVVGEDFQFGCNRSGNVATLVTMALAHRYAVKTVGPCIHKTERISSTLVRQYLQQGEFQTAAECLGRPYAIRGKVIRGKQLGRQLGYPTANINLASSRPPMTGVFVTKVERHGISHPAVASLGFNPTISDDHQISLEAFLLDFTADLYDEVLTVHFLHKLRDELKFADLRQLQQQIALDVQAARTYLGV